MKDELFRDLPNETYHAQTGCDGPMFSYSLAKKLLNKSPYHAWMDHPLLGASGNFKRTAAMDTGNIIHELLLGNGGGIVEIDANDFRTAAAKAERDQAYAEGKTSIIKSKMAAINNSMETIHKQIKEYLPEFYGKHESELSARWTMNNGVMVQNRWDWISPEQALMIDVKTSTDSSPQKVERKILDMDYHIQESLYTAAAERFWPELAGRWKWLYLFIEVEPPYMVSVIETGSSFKVIGENRVNRASDCWKNCLDNDNWPGYGRQMVTAPGWAMAKEEALQG